MAFVFGVNCQKQPQPTLKSRIWVKKTYFRKKTIWNSEIWQFREDPRAQNCAITPRILNSLNPQTAQIARDTQRSHGSKKNRRNICGALKKIPVLGWSAPGPQRNCSTLVCNTEKEKSCTSISQLSHPRGFCVEKRQHIEWKASSLIHQALLHDVQQCDEHHYLHDF